MMRDSSVAKTKLGEGQGKGRNRVGKGEEDGTVFYRYCQPHHDYSR